MDSQIIERLTILGTDFLNVESCIRVRSIESRGSSQSAIRILCSFLIGSIFLLIINFIMFLQFIPCFIMHDCWPRSWNLPISSMLFYSCQMMMVAAPSWQFVKTPAIPGVHDPCPSFDPSFFSQHQHLRLHSAPRIPQLRSCLLVRPPSIFTI